MPSAEGEKFGINRISVDVMMNRREFLWASAIGSVQQFSMPEFASLLGEQGGPLRQAPGSGNFGEWITDSFGLPAYHYTCNQLIETRALSPVHEQWRGSREHLHQVGNDRLTAVASNYGYVQVRQDEGSPKFLNDYCPGQNRFGGGIGYLVDNDTVVSTHYPGGAASFERVFGEGYLRKVVTTPRYQIDHAIVAPFGDDPVLLSIITLHNLSATTRELRWIEYWNCLNYQFSYRAWMQASVANDTTQAARLRREFGARFMHRFRVVAGGRGLMETQTFAGRSREDLIAWEKVEAYMKSHPDGSFGPPLSDLGPGAAMEDLHPPPTFLVSLDAPLDRFSTNGSAFFGVGGVARPCGLANELSNDLSTTGAGSAHLIERHIVLPHGETRTLAFLYGYLPEGFEIDSLVAKYSGDPLRHWSRSSAAWKSAGMRLTTPEHPWVERETSWHHYYLRSNVTHDSLFHEPILSQGQVYQYILGFQGAARDPLQHALPFIFSDGAVVRGVLRYTLKSLQPDGSIPYGIVGSGVPMPAAFHPSDQELYLLWLASEYVLATRDRSFLEETIPTYPREQTAKEDPTIRTLLRRSFDHFNKVIGVGEHGLCRLLNGDWNDEVVVSQVPAALSTEVRQRGESSLNAAMACYVLEHYARLLRYDGDEGGAITARASATAQRTALRAQWAGGWFRRAWLGPHLGWLGEEQIWLEPQAWALLGDAATPEQAKTLVRNLDELVRKPSPIGAMLQNKGTPAMKMQIGTGENGGVWPSINGPLVWALARTDGEMAWDEWKKNSLARHAEVYPDIWYGIWSGPDTYHSMRSAHPGATHYAEPGSSDPKARTDWGVNWTDFPVMNMHSHAWPLYSAAKLLGLEFHERGIRFKPNLPLAEYDFTSPLLGFRRSKTGYAGWYSPAVAGRWEVAVHLPASEGSRWRVVKVNGVAHSVGEVLMDGSKSLRFSGQSRPGAPMRWEIA